MTAPGRAERFRDLAETAFDILVIGGGISGAAVARDAARRGFRTALVEAADFAAGTSSRSSRLVHGGLRYLEHFEFDLVFEASQERRTLLRIATHLVRPLEFHFPIFRDGRIGRMKLDAGMWLYDALSLFRNIERHQMLDTEAMLAREPGLRAEGLLGGARYFDAQVDDARLVVTTIVAAVEAGATVVNRAEIVRVDASDWPGHRALVRDAESGREVEVDALAIVNATGAWAEQMLDRVDADARGPGPGEDAAAAVRIRPSRGTHIHVARERVGHSGALIFEAPRDGRVMFILPWREDLTLIGTTDEFFDGRPHEVAATPGDIAYLVEATRHLLPASKLGPEDVISAWAGLRPLVAPAADGDDEGAVSREFEVHQHPPGVFTLSGGKLTSHRHMAEATLDRVQAFLAPAGVKAIRKVDTDKVPLPGAALPGSGGAAQPDPGTCPLAGTRARFRRPAHARVRDESEPGSRPRRSKSAARREGGRGEAAPSGRSGVFSAERDGPSRRGHSLSTDAGRPRDALRDAGGGAPRRRSRGPGAGLDSRTTDGGSGTGTGLQGGGRRRDPRLGGPREGGPLNGRPCRWGHVLFGLAWLAAACAPADDTSDSSGVPPDSTPSADAAAVAPLPGEGPTREYRILLVNPLDVDAYVSAAAGAGSVVLDTVPRRDSVRVNVRVRADLVRLEARDAEGILLASTDLALAGDTLNRWDIEADTPIRRVTIGPESSLNGRKALYYGSDLCPDPALGAALGAGTMEEGGRHEEAEDRAGARREYRD